MKTGLAAGESRPEWTRLRASIDGAAHQRDAAWSGLYWYTSLPEALATARRENKPVLSLRLLGRLDEELSCARDVIPGLFGPGDFLRMVREAAAVLDKARGALLPSSPFKANLSSSSLDPNSISLMRAKAPRVSDAAFARVVATFERTLAEDAAQNARLRLVILPWLAGSPSLPALTERIYRDAFLTPRSDPWLGLVPVDTYSAIEGDPAPGPGGPEALEAGALTASKMIVERPLLAKMARTAR